MNNDKEYMGRIKDWWVLYPRLSSDYSKTSLGFIICGTFVDHPYLAGEEGYTSYVVNQYETANMGHVVETLNSYYTLIGEPNKPPVDHRE